jgi:hypothetical protein
MHFAGTARRHSAACPSSTRCSECFSRLIEANLREAIALLDAIAVGEMLVRPPAGSADEAKHAAAEVLLEVIHKRLADSLSASIARR